MRKEKGAKTEGTERATKDTQVGSDKVLKVKQNSTGEKKMVETSA